VRGLRGVAALLGVAGTLLGLPPARSETTPAPRPLRFLSFNVLHGGPWSGLVGHAEHLERRLEIALEELRRLDPDVLGLQEASTSRGRGNVAQRIAGALGFHHVYAPATVRIFHGETMGRILSALLNFTEGPAIVSRFPIVAWEAVDLPRCGSTYEARVLLHAEIEAPWGTFPVFSTHTRGDPCHTRRVAELVATRRGHRPAVLMGDFNAAEGSPAIAALTEEAGFVDAFRAANPGAPGFTVWQRVEAPERMARRRVDFVFLVPGQATAGRVLRSQVVLDRPRHLEDSVVLWPSDHYGVLAEIEVFPTSP
jgi:endonuclease/exonuclease/phosphatase family metal-dependent hydrolase